MGTTGRDDALLLDLDATGQAALIRKGDIAPAELLAAAIARIETLQPRVNALVGFDPEVYARLAAQVVEVASGLGLFDVRTIPVSALAGDNVVDRSARTPWYDGPSLLELLEEIPAAADPATEGFRLPVQVVLRPQGAAREARFRDYRGYAGQIAAGVVAVGDRVVALPSGRTSAVVGNPR